MEFAGRDYSHARALSLREKGINENEWFVDRHHYSLTCLHTIQTLTYEDWDPQWDFQRTGFVVLYVVEKVSIRKCSPGL